MANPTRNKNVQTSVTLADLLSIFRGTPADSPRQRARLADVQTRMNLPETLPDQTTNLLQAPPQQAAASLMDLSPMTDVTTGQTQDMGSLIEPLLSQPKNANNLLTEKEQEEIAKDPEKLQKYSRAGNFFARVGGFQPISAEALAQTPPEKLDIYNAERLAARNRGIGEMLLMLSDALGGRDVAMRALERQQARQPAPIKATEAIKREELAVLQKLKQLETKYEEDETIQDFTMEDLIEGLSPFEKIVYQEFIKKPQSQSFIKDFLSGEFNNNTAQQGPIDLGKISE